MRLSATRTECHIPFCLEYIQSNPDVLRLNWKDLSNKIIMQAYISCGRVVPRWLLEFVESVTLDDLDDEETEELRMFFVDEINRKTQHISTDVYDSPSGKNEKSVKGSDAFYDRVFDVINERQIPYMVMHHARNGYDYVCFTTGLKKALHNANQACYDVKSIAELLDWSYGIVKLPKPTRVMKVRFDKFLNFLYPNYDEMEEDN